MNKIRILYMYLKTKYFLKFNSRIQLKKYQKNKLNKFSKYISNNSKYYKNITISNILKSPVITKKEFMEYFDDMNTENIKKEDALNTCLKSEENRDFTPEVKENISVGLSSGTSGNKGIFLVSKKEREEWAGVILAKAQINIFKKNKIAFFLRANNNLYETVNNGNIKFKFYDLFENFEKQVDSLNNFYPDILIAPASVLVMLSKHKNSGNLHIRPSKIFSVAEVLEIQDKQFISKTFKIKVGQVYQCTEGFLGITCKYGTLHINEDILIMQKKYLDKEEKKFKPIITDFTRKTQPVIRYELNDILTEKKTRCKCGSPLLAIDKIEGRCDDILYLENKKGQLIPIFPDFLRRIIINSSDSIKDYYVEQNQKNKINIFIDVAKNNQYVNEKILSNIKKFLEEGNIMDVEIIFLRNRPQLENGTKKRRIRNLYNS